jgi:CRP/FNR family cyclic AMP-dependent transcriptional regulator
MARRADPHQTQMSELSAQLEGFLKRKPDESLSDFESGIVNGAVPASGLLSHIPLFSRLDPCDQADLHAMMKRERFEPNQTIFWLGDRGDSFYLLESGQALVTVPNSKGEHVTIASVGPGGFFGEISLLDGGVRTATVRAAEPTTTFSLSRSALREFLLKNPSAGIDILAVMGQRLRANNEVLRQSTNPNEAFAQTRVTLWQRISDVIATVAASQWFTVFHVCWFGAWILLNIIGAFMTNPPKMFAFDPFPFGLLTMVVSLEAIFLSIFVMVSQNRQSEKDRLRTDLDFQVNVKAETEIVGMSRRLEDIEAMLKEIAGKRQP